MKKNLILLLGFIVFIGTGICFLFLVYPIEKESPILFYFLLTIVIASAMTTGQYFYNERGIYDWRWIREGKTFEILSISADFSMTSKAVPTGQAVVNLENFGIAILKLPTNPELWLGHIPKRGEKFFIVGEHFYFIK